ncbi:SpoIIE family protein phosphatase [Flammeovirga sp. SJP92]|uniref:SpoIIE family protein phosphatase n=1 Tax=Flammeovirga sp. SJP92 TaxID=1775430 RepID=UPI000793CF1B|nr:SpoIIE family protein phosphatase [Flammeovirga sp. SJP92]KXX71041.1 hypothetical protein AVL50_10590 [Flammeovirga sp. SJP92]
MSCIIEYASAKNTPQIDIANLKEKSIRHLNLLTDSTLYFTDKMKKIALEIGDREAESFAYQISGSYLIKKGEITEGFENTIKALHISEELKDWPDVSTICNNIGVFYFRKKDYKKALKYYLKGLESIRNGMYESDEITLEQRRHEVSMLLNIGEVYMKWGHNQLGLKYEDEAYVNAIKYNFEEEEAYVLAIKAQIYANLGEMEEASSYINEAIQQFEVFEDQYALCEYKLMSAEYYFISSNLNMARKQAVEVYHIANALEAMFFKRDVCELLAKIEKEDQNWKAAFDYVTEYNEVKSKIDNIEIETRVEKIKSSYESEKHISEIYSLKLEKEYNERVMNDQEKFIYVLVFIFIVSGIFIYFLYRFYRDLKVAYQKISDKNFKIEIQAEEIAAQRDHLQEYVELIDSKNRRISAGVNYATRIQNASLPIRSNIEKLFKELMLFYKPRDLVSGDFYYSSGILEGEEDKMSIIACSDCTGHGVPGAFMSLIGTGLLNEIIKVKHITSPKDILENLHTQLQMTLKQHESFGVQDGMDISIALINYTKKKVIVSSAKNSWLYYQNGRQFVMKGDRRSIGGMDLNSSAFVNHEVDFSEEETYIYLYSDGYQDQLGGPNNKKFLVKRFRELIDEIHHLPAKEQEKALLHRFELWRKQQNESQTDDILVIGFKL